jgi:hypothetical protein
MFDDLKQADTSNLNILTNNILVLGKLAHKYHVNESILSESPCIWSSQQANWMTA